MNEMVYDRIAPALVKFLDCPGTGLSSFIRVEGVPEGLAQKLCRIWPLDYPPLRVASATPEVYGDFGLIDETATRLRNTSESGLVLVECEGASVSDHQGVGQLVSVSLQDLMDSPSGLVALCESHQRVDPDGIVSFVRDAIAALDRSERPTAEQYARFLDAIASGLPALEALPNLGAFPDHIDDANLTRDRVVENLRLARRCMVEGIQRIDDLKRKSIRVFNRTEPKLEEARGKTARLIRAVQQAEIRALADLLNYDQASEIFANLSPDLPHLILENLEHYKRNLIESNDEADSNRAADIAWYIYEECAYEIESEEGRKEAAEQILAFDDSESRRVLDPDVRRKLESVLRAALRKRTGSVVCGDPLQALCVGAARLDGQPKKIDLAQIVGELDCTSERGCAAWLSMILVSLRTSKSIRRARRSHRIEVHRLLTLSPKDILRELSNELGTSDMRASLARLIEGADVRERYLPPVDFVISDESGDAVRVRWQPTAEDLAFACTVVFASDRHPILISGRTDALEFANHFAGGITAEPATDSSIELRAAEMLGDISLSVLSEGLDSLSLREYANEWAKFVAEIGEQAPRREHERLSLLGCVLGEAGSAVVTGIHPLGAEWLSRYFGELEALFVEALNPGGIETEDSEETPGADRSTLAELSSIVAKQTPADYPAYLVVPDNDDPLLCQRAVPGWAEYSSIGEKSSVEETAAAAEKVILKILSLQPELTSHLKVVAFGDTACDAALKALIRLLDQSVRGNRVRRTELICVEGKPSEGILLEANARVPFDERNRLTLRIFGTTQEARAAMSNGGESSALAHLALVADLNRSMGQQPLIIERVRMEVRPNSTADPLFAPRTFPAPGTRSQLRLAPTSATPVWVAWACSASAADDHWRDRSATVFHLSGLRRECRRILANAHDVAITVATIDRYVSRESLRRMMPEVAILHQERRISSETPNAIVVSQHSGKIADRAVMRSLQSARIVEDDDQAREIGEKLRKAAAEGHGVLALEAATSGAGVNELVAHTAAYALLGEAGSPWPLPPDCRILAVSLDEYQHWFPTGMRADFLALALDQDAREVHLAAVEVKARRSDPERARQKALEQIRQTLAATLPATSRTSRGLHQRIWWGRIAGAALSIAREIGFDLTEEEFDALEDFRVNGAAEWAGLGMLFGPDMVDERMDRHFDAGADRIPIRIEMRRMTSALLERASASTMTSMRTVEPDQPAPRSERKKRRPEGGQSFDTAKPSGEEETREELGESGRADTHQAGSLEVDLPQEPGTKNAGATSEATGLMAPQAPIEEGLILTLGQSAGANHTVSLRFGFDDAAATNAHMEIWGASGQGKTQFIRCLLRQMSLRDYFNFGIADFKNDYGGGFAESIRGRFFDLWKEGAPLNPLAFDVREGEDLDRALQTAVIELRDIFEEACRSYVSLGPKQLGRLRKYLEEILKLRRTEGRWPTLRTLDGKLDEELQYHLGDLTRHNIFGDGPPLTTAITQRSIFGLESIPGSGLTTVLAASFILSAVRETMMAMDPVKRSVRYVLVVDEAHRVSKFKSIDKILREGRSKGLAVWLATQNPTDLPMSASTNAQTKVCFQLDPLAAKEGAKRLDPSDRDLASSIQNLSPGHAFVRIGNRKPVRVRVVQDYRGDCGGST